MFLAQCLGLETSSRPFYDFNEICQLLVVDIYHFILPYSLPYSSFQKQVKHWKIGNWVIEAGY